jgi:hypothetical protein
MEQARASLTFFVTIRQDGGTRTECKNRSVTIPAQSSALELLEAACLPLRAGLFDELRVVQVNVSAFQSSSLSDATAIIGIGLDSYMDIYPSVGHFFIGYVAAHAGTMLKSCLVKVMS